MCVWWNSMYDGKHEVSSLCKGEMTSEMCWGAKRHFKSAMSLL